MCERGSASGNSPYVCGTGETGGLLGSSVRTAAISTLGCDVAGTCGLDATGAGVAATGVAGANSRGLEAKSGPNTSFIPLVIDVRTFSAICAAFAFMAAL